MGTTQEEALQIRTQTALRCPAHMRPNVQWLKAALPFRNVHVSSWILHMLPKVASKTTHCEGPYQAVTLNPEGGAGPLPPLNRKLEPRETKWW